MKISSKEITEDTKKNKKQKLSDANSIRNLPDEIFLAVLDYSDFPTLCRVKPVCKFWMEKIGISVEGRRGNKAFTTNADLTQRVREYSGPNKVKFAEALLRMYGWPINK